MTGENQLKVNQKQREGLKFCHNDLALATKRFDFHHRAVYVHRLNEGLEVEVCNELDFPEFAESLQKALVELHEDKFH